MGCETCGGPASHKECSMQCPAKFFFCKLCSQIGHYPEFCKSSPDNIAIAQEETSSPDDAIKEEPPVPDVNVAVKDLSNPSNGASDIQEKQSSDDAAVMKKKSSSKGCRHCGTTHGYRNCPAHDQTCDECKRKNHFTHLCPTLKPGPSAKNSKKLNKENSSSETPASDIILVKDKSRQTMCLLCETAHTSGQPFVETQSCDQCVMKNHIPGTCPSMKRASSKDVAKPDKENDSSSSATKREMSRKPKQKNENSRPQTPSVIDSKSIKEKQPPSKLCRYCETSHIINQCPAKTQRCNQCQGKGHFTRLCPSAKPRPSRNSPNQRAVNGNNFNPPCYPGAGAKFTSSAPVNRKNQYYGNSISHKPQRNDSGTRMKRECTKCGSSHAIGNCAARGSICQICKKCGHFEDYCIFKKDCSQCDVAHNIGSQCPAKNSYCKNCFLQGHLTQCCFKPTPEEIEEWKRDEENALCRYIFTSANREYGRNAAGPVLEKRKKEAKEIRQRQIDRTAQEQKKARNLELCFLVDATGSMGPYLEAVKIYINKIVDSIIQPQANMSQYGWADSIRLAFVGYRDFWDGEKRFEILNGGKFTDSVKEFKDFCGSLIPIPNKDFAEDVLGGLDKALSLDWNEKYGTKVIYHIADAPSHGKKYHKLCETYDLYLDKEHPDGLDDEVIFAKMRKMKIQYYFGSISKTTDKMIQVFSKSYGMPIYSHDIKNEGNILEAVLSAVSFSITTKITEATVTMALSDESIDERKFEIDKKEPDWDQITEITVSSLSYELLESIEEITDREFTIPMKLQYEPVRISSNPFAKGGDRLAYYGKTFSKHGVKDQVFKEYIKLGNKENISIHYKIPNEISTISAYFAKQFDQKIKKAIGEEEPQIQFLKISTIRIRERKDKNGKEKIRYMCTENRFRNDDHFYKFTNNATFFMTEESAKKNGIDLKLIEMLLAFSHFTYQESNGYLMIVDLQGVINDKENGTKKFVLTDPSIHCQNILRFGKTNFGENGMKNFFDQHQCNSYCQHLKLTKPMK